MNDIPCGDNPYIHGESTAMKVQVPGFLYILTNESMPDLIKVGITKRDVWDRAAELSRATGVPSPFQISHFFRVRDIHSAEKLAHYELRDYRLEGREFFKCDPWYAYCRLEGLLNGAWLKINRGDLDWPKDENGRPIGFGFDGDAQ